jgi:hypothetical protein
MKGKFTEVWRTVRDGFGKWQSYGKLNRNPTSEKKIKFVNKVSADGEYFDRFKEKTSPQCVP